MHDRCKRHPEYAHVSVCPRWNDFLTFLDDMGKRPEGMTIDRIDGTKGYSPDNCRWADLKTQLLNRKSTHWIEYKGKRQTLIQWAAELGMNKQTLCERLKRGWTVERAFTTPVQIRRSRPASLAA